MKGHALGLWKLNSVTGDVTPYDQNGLFGHNFKVTFTLEYQTSTFGNFTEPPRLDWHEKFIMIEHHKRERWVFEKNMYEHNPTSATLLIWPKRYVEAYEAAAGRAYTGKGSCQLLTKTGTAVTQKQLGAATSGADKANAVRKYLKSHGGRLKIMVHDIPSLNTPVMWTPPALPPLPARPGITIGSNRLPPAPLAPPAQIPEHKERLLLFNVGLLNGTPRWMGSQHVAVTANVAPGLWPRHGAAGWVMQDLPLPLGYTDVPPPALVSNPRAPLFSDGECW